MQKQAKEIKKHLFLLGGHDLEMQTIVQILTDRNVIFKDRYLQWDNALLSQYEEEIQQYGAVYYLWCRIERGHHAPH